MVAGQWRWFVINSEVTRRSSLFLRTAVCRHHFIGNADSKRRSLIYIEPAACSGDAADGLEQTVSMLTRVEASIRESAAAIWPGSQHFDVTIGSQHDVLRFDIAMNDFHFVRRAQGWATLITISITLAIVAGSVYCFARSCRR